jgi:hypothetical protein
LSLYTPDLTIARQFHTVETTASSATITEAMLWPDLSRPAASKINGDGHGQRAYSPKGKCKIKRFGGLLGCGFGFCCLIHQN